MDKINVFDLISGEEYLKLVEQHGKNAQAIPSMNLFNVKKDKKGKPSPRKIQNCSTRQSQKFLMDAQR